MSKGHCARPWPITSRAEFPDGASLKLTSACLWDAARRHACWFWTLRMQDCCSLTRLATRRPLLTIRGEVAYYSYRRSRLLVSLGKKMADHYDRIARIPVASGH